MRSVDSRSIEKDTKRTFPIPPPLVKEIKRSPASTGFRFPPLLFVCPWMGERKRESFSLAE
jgi:hypothetical protein